MCTAAGYLTKDFYFGRTLDYEFSYGEKVVVVSRNMPLNFRHARGMKSHHAIMGMAHVEDNYPLFYDGMNEKGLCMAGLNFVGNAVYSSEEIGEKDNIAQFEFIPWVLSQCEKISDVMVLLGKINLTNEPFHEKLPCAELHWIIADREKAITVEFVSDGMKIYDNPLCVLTNNPPFDKQMFNLNNYIGLSVDNPEGTFANSLSKADSYCYSRGMGGLGLPGDLSSQSRFVRVAFVKANSISKDDEASSVSQFFHILNSVDQQRGLCSVNGKYEITIYTSCMNANKGVYYYTTYDNHRINGVDMFKENLNGESLVSYPLVTSEEINIQN